MYSTFIINAPAVRASALFAMGLDVIVAKLADLFGQRLEFAPMHTRRQQGATHLITARAWLEVLVGKIKFFNAQRAKAEVVSQLPYNTSDGKALQTYQNSSSSSMTESICGRLDIVTVLVRVY